MTHIELRPWHGMKGRLETRKDIIEADLNRLAEFEKEIGGEYREGVVSGERRQLRYWLHSVTSMLEDVQEAIEEIQND